MIVDLPFLRVAAHRAILRRCDRFELYDFRAFTFTGHHNAPSSSPKPPPPPGGAAIDRDSAPIPGAAKPG